MYNEDIFLDNVLRLIKDNNLSVSQAEKMAGLGKGSIYNWIYKSGKPNITSVIKLSKLFNVSIDFLVFGDKGNKNV